jgi:hypothetical protein
MNDYVVVDTSFLHRENLFAQVKTFLEESRSVSFTAPNVGIANIRISNDSIGKLMYKTGPYKLCCMLHLSEILLHATLDRIEMPKETNKNMFVKNIHWLKTTVKIDSYFHLFYISIKEYNDHFKIYSCHLDIKKPL